MSSKTFAKVRSDLNSSRITTEQFSIDPFTNEIIFGWLLEPTSKKDGTMDADVDADSP